MCVSWSIEVLFCRVQAAAVVVAKAAHIAAPVALPAAAAAVVVISQKALLAVAAAVAVQVHPHHHHLGPHQAHVWGRLLLSHPLALSLQCHLPHQGKQTPLYFPPLPSRDLLQALFLNGMLMVQSYDMSTTGGWTLVISKILICC